MGDFFLEEGKLHDRGKLSTYRVWHPAEKRYAAVPIYVVNVAGAQDTNRDTERLL